MSAPCAPWRNGANYLWTPKGGTTVRAACISSSPQAFWGVTQGAGARRAFKVPREEALEAVREWRLQEV
jgi:hypothetical protein